MKKLLIFLPLFMGIVLLTGCNDADVVSSNLSHDADNLRFKEELHSLTPNLMKFYTPLKGIWRL